MLVQPHANGLVRAPPCQAAGARGACGRARPRVPLRPRWRDAAQGDGGVDDAAGDGGVGGRHPAGRHSTSGQGRTAPPPATSRAPASRTAMPGSRATANSEAPLRRRGRRSTADRQVPSCFSAAARAARARRPGRRRRWRRRARRTGCAARRRGRRRGARAPRGGGMRAVCAHAAPPRARHAYGGKGGERAYPTPRTPPPPPAPSPPPGRTPPPRPGPRAPAPAAAPAAAARPWRWLGRRRAGGRVGQISQSELSPR